MKKMLVCACVCLAINVAARASSLPGPALQVIDDIARTDHMTACAVRQTLGDQVMVAMAQYDAHPAARTGIQRLVRQRYDQWLAMQSGDGRAVVSTCASTSQQAGDTSQRARTP